LGERTLITVTAGADRKLLNCIPDAANHGVEDTRH